MSDIVGTRLVHKYISQRLEPQTAVEEQIGWTASESLAFIHSLAAEGFKMDDDGEVSKIVNPQWSTRITIRELYNEADDIVHNYQELITDGISSEEIIKYYDNSELSIERDHRTKFENFPGVNSYKDFLEYITAQKISRRLLPFFSISQVLIEEYSVELLDRELIIDEYEGNKNTIRFLRERSQPTREELIQRTGLLEGHVVSMMVQIRRERNEIIHNLQGPSYLDMILESVEEMDKCIKVISNLESELEIDVGFDW